jgi:hypothetical protein
MKLSLNSGIQTYQILKNVDEVCIPSLSIILLAVCWCAELLQAKVVEFLVKMPQHRPKICERSSVGS